MDIKETYKDVIEDISIESQRHSRKGGDMADMVVKKITDSCSF